MQNTDLLTYEGTPKTHKILVYQKGLVGFYRQTNDPTFKNKKEAQAFYALRYNVDSMPYSDLWYQKGKVYRRLFPTTRKACKALLARLSPVQKDWIIQRIQPTENFFHSPNTGYRLCIMGQNTCDHNQKEFCWTINPDLVSGIWQGERYDFSNAILEIGEYREHKEQYYRPTRIFVVKETCRVSSFEGAIQILKSNL